MTSPHFPKCFPNPVAITVDRYTLGEAIRAAYMGLDLSDRNNSWCIIADYVLEDLTASTSPDAQP